MTYSLEVTSIFIVNSQHSNYIIAEIVNIVFYSLPSLIQDCEEVIILILIVAIFGES